MPFANPEQTVLIYILFIWSIFWKGLALWRAARFEQRNWFIAMLILNTVGILEIVYLFWFAKHRLQFSELKFWEEKTRKSKEHRDK